MLPRKYHDLSKRWLTADGINRQREVFTALRKGRCLENIEGIETVEGRTDLRGFPFPSANEHEHIASGGLVWSLVFGKSSISDALISNIDFSFCMPNDVLWTRCRFDNVRFNNVSNDMLAFWACSFSNVEFIDSDLRNATLSGEDRDKTCSYDRADFSGASFGAFVTGAASFRDCDFTNARYDSTDFDGSRFERCRFVGRIFDVTFRRKSKARIKPTWPHKMLDYSLYCNEMTGVDFSAANLQFVQFDGINLDNCILPHSDDQFLLKNQRQVLLAVRSAIVETWPPGPAQKACNMLDVMYLNPDAMSGSPLTWELSHALSVFINRADFVSTLGADAGNRLFELIVSLAKAE